MGNAPHLINQTKIRLIVEPKDVEFALSENMFRL
jgi:hypothetical protein